MEKMAPSEVGKGGFPKAMRLATAVGFFGGFLYFYQRSIRMWSSFFFLVHIGVRKFMTALRSRLQGYPGE